MEKQLNVPKLRFSEFEGKWVKKKLIDICDKIIDGTHFSPKSIEGNRKYITSKNIRNTGLDLLNCNYISEEEHDWIYKRCPVKFGEILLTKDGANVGNCCLNTLYEEFSLLSSVAVLNGKKEILQNGFLLQILQSNYGIKEISNIVSGQAITRITLEKIKKIELNISFLPEQIKITSFLSTVDNKLTHLKKKKSLLEQYKKGVTQKIFSQELRFKDVKGEDFMEWKEMKLGEVGESYNGLTGKTKENFGTGKPYIQYKQIFDDSKIDISRFDFVDIREKENQNIVIFGDAFFTVSSETPEEVGMASVLLDEVGELYLNSFCFGYRATSLDIINPYFSRYLFRSESFRKDVVVLAQGSTRFNISKTQFMKLVIKLPSFPEQTKIANFLSAIDDKINHSGMQIEKLELWKKGLMQQMFC